MTLSLAVGTAHYMASSAGLDKIGAVFGLSDKRMASMDTNNLLLIGVCVTVVHLAPIRWVALLPLEVAAARAYTVPAYTLEGVCSVRRERFMFAGPLSERALRFQMECQLSGQQSNRCWAGLPDRSQR